MVFGVVTVSSAWLDKLPEDLRTIVMEAAQDIQDEATEIGIEYAKKADKEWAAAGVTIVELDPEAQQELFATVSPIGDKYLSENEKTEPVWQELQKALQQVSTN